MLTYQKINKVGRAEVCRAEVGKRGENIAAFFLVRRGCVLLARNFKTRYGEIDLILEDCSGGGVGVSAEKCLVFCEVKTRSKGTVAQGAWAVNFKKRQRLLKAAKSYVKSRGLFGVKMRFDVVVILLGEAKVKIVHYKNVEV